MTKRFLNFAEAHDVAWNEKDFAQIAEALKIERRYICPIGKHGVSHVIGYLVPKEAMGTLYDHDLQLMVLDDGSYEISINVVGGDIDRMIARFKAAAAAMELVA